MVLDSLLGHSTTNSNLLHMIFLFTLILNNRTTINYMTIFPKLAIRLGLGLGLGLLHGD